MLTFKDFVNASIIAKTMICEGRKPKAAKGPKEEGEGKSLKYKLMNKLIWTLRPNTKETGRPQVADFQFDKLKKYINDNLKEEFDAACKADGISSFDDAIDQEHLPVNVNNFLVKLQKKMNNSGVKKTGSSEEKEISDIIDNIVIGNAAAIMNNEEYSYKSTHFNIHDPNEVTERKFDGLGRAIDTFDDTKGASALTHIKNSVHGHILNTQRGRDEGIANGQSLDDTASTNNTTHVDKDMKVSELIPDECSNIFDNYKKEEILANVHEALETLPDEEQELIEMYYFENMTFQEMLDELRDKGFNNIPTVRKHLMDAVNAFGIRFKDLFMDKYNEAI